MSFADYMRKADDAAGVSRNLARVSSVVGADTVAKAGPTASMKEFLRSVGSARPRDVKDGLGTLAGAIAGGYLLRGTHPVLGVIGGASLGRNVPAALMHPEDRSYALKNMFTTGGGVAGSLWWKAHPALGFLVGHLVAGLLARWND